MDKFYFFVGTILVSSFIGCGTPDVSKEDSSVKVTKSQSEISEDALLSMANSYLDVFTPNHAPIIAGDLALDDSGLWKYETDELLLRFNENNTNQVYYNSFDYDYMMSWEMGEDNSDLEPISVEEAISIVQDTAKSLNIDLTAEPGMKLDFDPRLTSIQGSHGYMVGSILSYREIYIMGGLSAHLSPKDGTITQFNSTPFIIPEAVSNPIPEEKAIELAQQHLTLLGKEDMMLDHISQFYGDLSWYEDPDDWEQKGPYRLAWDVTFTHQHPESEQDIPTHDCHPTELLVDAETGKVIEGLRFI